MKKKNIKSEKMWAIVGDVGLYTGTYLTRQTAIYEHCECYLTPYNPCIRIDQEHINKTWRRCKRLGDKAVKVTIAWEE